MTGQDTVKKLIVGEEDGKEEENETDARTCRTSEIKRAVLTNRKNTEIMSNFEYDRLYDELLSLEKRTGNNACLKPDGQCGV